MKKLMNKNFRKTLLIVLCISFAFAGFAQKNTHPPVKIIFDSDIGPDYDDVGAIAILHAFADHNEAEILATVASNKYSRIASVLNIFNTYFNRPDIPIGVPKGEGVNIPDSQHWSDTLVAKYPHTVRHNNDVPDAVKVYRKVLSQQPDNSVTIVTIGFLTNLYNLLNSAADEYSSLSGRDLVKKKVKLLVSMAGGFPTGREFNLDSDVKASKAIFGNWPTKLIYSGFEIGAIIKTGLPIVHNSAIHHSPVKDVFRISIPLSTSDAAGRMSWDETAVLVAVRGVEPFFSLHSGKITINDDGSNGWDDKGKGQYYLVMKESPKKIAETIDQLMMHQPVK
ncbi:MAG: nucleoside hydrolase [Chitinophagaceae bacterium]|jgi:inosine-uridine nucleoside N-ribohydrolase|nr:nucleoside hydrolase [Chitinophagaceae bacterium]